MNSNLNSAIFSCIAFAATLSPPVFAYDESQCDANVAGNYSYLKLSISRSQEWCLVHGRHNDDQCSKEYIVHGLWPQCNSGHPSKCDLRESSLEDAIDEAAIRTFMPSDYLIKHEWNTHGTCTGGRRSDYFATTAEFFNNLNLPSLEEGVHLKSALIEKLLQHNPDLPEKAIELSCDEESDMPRSDRQTLDEIRICYSVDGDFIACKENENSCEDKIKVRRIGINFPIESVVPGVNAASHTDITIMAANITSGDNQSYDAGHGIRIFQGLKPDIALIQEVNYKSNSSADYRQFTNLAFGADYELCAPQPGQQIPNGIASVFQITECGYWDDPHLDNRDFVFARIDLPGPNDLLAVSVHLKTKPRSQAEKQANSLAHYIRSHLNAENDYLVVGGDFNSPSLNDPALDVLSDLVDVSKPAKDERGSSGTNSSRNKPYDHVLPGKKLTSLEVPLILGGVEYPTGMVFDSRIFTPLEEVAPVEAGDSGAQGMQHMAVMKKFRLF